jgi:hypothetical protein
MRTFEDIRDNARDIIYKIALDYMNFQNESKEYRESTMEELEERIDVIIQESEDKYQGLMDDYGDLHKKHGNLLKCSIKELQEQYFSHENGN